MANRRPFVQNRSVKRKSLWADVLTTLASAAVGASKSGGNLGTSLGIITQTGLTLIRTRGQLNLHFDPTSINDVLEVGVGMALFSTDAFAAGVASLPGPLSDADYDWAYHRMVMFSTFTATESDTSIQQNLNIEIDSKAMRKMNSSQTLGWVVEGIIHSGGGTFDVSLVARHLFKLN